MFRASSERFVMKAWSEKLVNFINNIVYIQYVSKNVLALGYSELFLVKTQVTPVLDNPNSLDVRGPLINTTVIKH